MKKIFCIITFFAFVSCDSGSFFQRSLSADDLSSDPRIHLSEKGESVDIRTINRSDSFLNLSDKVIFSDKEEKRPANMKPLADFKNAKKLKIKVSSFCHYEKSFESEPSAGRVAQELGSESYRSSFSIFEILPMEVLVNNIDRDFYCSFVFAFKDKKGFFNHYNIAQQLVKPSFDASGRSHRLSLVRETETGHYSSMSQGVIHTNQNLSKIMLVNNTDEPAEDYYLFCEGLELITVPGAGSEAIPLFVNLMKYETESQLTGVKRCRVFSKNQKQLTGMSSSFKINFHGLSYESSVNLADVNPPAVFGVSGWPVEKGGDAPVNGYFHFKQDENSQQDYSSVDITARTKCVDRSTRDNVNLFGVGNVIEKEIRFSFREKFPVMSVTPKELFQMGIADDEFSRARDLIYKTQRLADQAWEDSRTMDIHGSGRGRHPFLHLGFRGVGRQIDSLSQQSREKENLISCFYSFRLINRNKPEEAMEFPEVHYSLSWDRRAYGVDYTFEKQYQGVLIKDPVQFFKDRKEKGLKLNSFLHEFSGSFTLNFFDIVNSPSFETEGHRLNQASIECHNGENKDVQAVKIPINYNFQSNYLIPLQSLFLDVSTIHTYVENNSLTICRFFLYENDMLRYFSDEMRIIPNSSKPAENSQ